MKQSNLSTHTTSLHLDERLLRTKPYPKVQITKFKVQKPAKNYPPKCKNCTLEEIALLRIVQKNPSATQKEIAAEIGKSERTVKSITIALQEKNILRRVNGKRNGYWEIVEDSIQQGSNIDKNE